MTSKLATLISFIAAGGGGDSSSSDSGSGGFRNPGHDDSLVKSMWIAVTSLIFLWLAAMLTRQAAAFVERRSNQEVIASRNDTNTSEDGEERDPLLPGGVRARDASARARQWGPRLDRAADALRHAVLMLLAATIFASIPLPYTCVSNPNLRPGLPIPPAPTCETCVATGVTLATSILAWVFLALSALWFVMELVVVDAASGAIARTCVGVACFPLILAMFVITFKEWATIEARDVPCK
ncbi:hypothetical protein HKX48_003566 [Thoreauomyces humboldtii]|nr:hypothetical protein HKX48_003566 [Thoreauomyces humboldtii]